MSLNQEKIDKIISDCKTMVCSICQAPEHNKHSFDYVYFQNDGTIIAVVNKSCRDMFDNAFRATFYAPFEALKGE